MNPDTRPLETHPSVGEVWDKVLAVTADAYAALSAGDQQWAERVLADAGGNGVQLQAALFWSWLLAHDHTDRTVAMVDRTGAETWPPTWAGYLAELQATQDMDGSWGSLRAVRVLMDAQEDGPAVFSSLLHTLAASAWMAYSTRRGPLPGGPAGVLVHVNVWGGRIPWEGRRYFLAGHRQTALRLTLLAEEAAALVGVVLDRDGKDPARRLVAAILDRVRNPSAAPLRIQDPEEFLRLASAVLALELPYLAGADRWVPAGDDRPPLVVFAAGDAVDPDLDVPADGRLPVLHLECPVVEGEPGWAERGEHTLLRLARLVAMDDGEAFEVLMELTLDQEGLVALAATAAVEVLGDMALGAEEALGARP